MLLSIEFNEIICTEILLLLVPKLIWYFAVANWDNLSPQSPKDLSGIAGCP